MIKIKCISLLSVVSLLFALTVNAKAPVNTKKIGVTFSSFGENDVFRFDELEGAASYNGDGFYVIGVNYLTPINKILSFETGVEYAHHKLTVDPAYYPDLTTSSYDTSFSLVSIPLNLRVRFLRYFFLQGGAFLDFDSNSPIEDQTGIGANFGIGLNYDFDNGFSVFASTYEKIHALVPFSFESNYQRIWESGIRVGIMYQLHKK